MKKDVQENLTNKFGELKGKYPAIASLANDVLDYSDTKQRLILEIMTRGDDKILALINK